jgi:hypothetical protein
MPGSPTPTSLTETALECGVERYHSHRDRPPCAQIITLEPANRSIDSGLIGRDNEIMRKRVLGSTLLPIDAADGHEWLKLQDLAQVEVTSEADGYPIETVFNFGAGPGWRAASPGIQRIRLVFDQPQSIRRMRLQFNESDVARTQEFTVRWSGRPDEPLKEVVRQQWNFSPDSSTAESEDYAIDLKRVSILELTIDPDRGAGEALAKLADWRLV